MMTYAEILNYAIPFFMVLILIEWAVGYSRGKQVIRSFDTISSLSSGVSNAIKDVLGLAIVILSYEWMHGKLALSHIESSWVMYLLAFVGLDFAGYWGHRLEHEVNILWNRHIIHHSSEEFNLACALRQNVSAILGVFFFLLVPMALIGVDPKVVAIAAPIHLFAQFWYHTRLIDKMGVLEHILVTPSHHRVHHAINDEYLDRNYSQIFIVWDKMFGTFQEELEDVPPVYGVKRQVLTWNPIVINYQHLWLLITDAWHTKSWADKLKVFYMPTGWRPADRLAKAPVVIVENPEQQEKYDTPASTKFHIWMWVNLVITIALSLYLFDQMADITPLHVGLYGAMMILFIFSYTSLMDRSHLAIWTGIICLGIAAYLSYAHSGWMSLGLQGAVAVITFLTVSLLAAFYFLKTEPLERRFA